MLPESPVLAERDFLAARGALDFARHFPPPFGFGLQVGHCEEQLPHFMVIIPSSFGLVWWKAPEGTRRLSVYRMSSNCSARVIEARRLRAALNCSRVCRSAHT